MVIGSLNPTPNTNLVMSAPQREYRRPRKIVNRRQLSWSEPFHDFLISLEARNRADKTVRFYRVQLGQLIRWAERENIAFDEFGKRHLDRFLAERRSAEMRNGATTPSNP